MATGRRRSVVIVYGLQCGINPHGAGQVVVRRPSSTLPWPPIGIPHKAPNQMRRGKNPERYSPCCQAYADRTTRQDHWTIRPHHKESHDAQHLAFMALPADEKQIAQELLKIKTPFKSGALIVSRELDRIDNRIRILD